MQRVPYIRKSVQEGSYIGVAPYRASHIGVSLYRGNTYRGRLFDPFKRLAGNPFVTFFTGDSLLVPRRLYKSIPKLGDPLYRGFSI